MASLSSRLRRLVAQFKRRAMLYRMVAMHPRTPRVARWLLALTLAYAFMPFDLIPDWIPVLGLLDDLLILPLLIWLALKTVPRNVYEECEQQLDLKLRQEDDDGTQDG